MISKTMEQKLNEQITMELHASYIYLAMSAYCSSISLNGIAQWFMGQADEEREHAMKIYEYVLDQDGKIELGGLEKPEMNYSSLQAVFEATLAHEQKVTASIHDLVALARGENDYATEVMLQWFVTEQIEEESTVRDILDQLKLVGDSGPGLFALNAKLGSRPAEGEEGH